MAGRRHRVPRRGAAEAGRDGRDARAGAAARRVARTCAATSRTASARSATCSTATTRSPPTTPTRPPTSSRALQERIDAADAWNLDTMLETAMDALRLPPGDADVTNLSGGERRRVALCRLLLQRPRPAAARRAHQPPRRRVGRLARAPPRGVQGHRRRGHPRPLLPRQRRRLDPRARPRPRDPVPGQLLVLARAEERAPRAGGARRQGARARRSPPSSSGCARTRRAGARSPRPGSPATRRCSPRTATSSSTSVQIHIPAGPRLGDMVIEADGAAQGLRRQAADRGPLVLAAARRGSSA